MKYFLGLSSQYSNMDVLRHVFSYGSEYDLSELRAFLAAHYGSTYDHTAVYANGRTALNVAIKAVTKRGARVVVTSLTCYAVVQAVKAAGCVPIYADVDPKTLHFGKKELENAIKGENNVQAVIVQNNLGIPADIEGIEEVAKANKLVIIEDLAHCAGVKYADGREAGTVGRAVALSFGKGKSIDTVTGGAVIFTDQLDTPVAQPTNTPKFKDNFRARMYPLFSLMIRGLYSIHPKAGKYVTAAFVRLGLIKRSADGDVNNKLRLTYWQCKLALAQLQALPHRGRKPIRDFYLVKDRESVLRKFELDGYFFNDIWYDVPVAPARYFSKADFHPDQCPIAAKMAKEIVNIPTYYESAEMKSALKIIQRYSADETEFEELKDEDNLTEAEKKAKIKAEKKAKSKAKRSKKASSKMAKKVTEKVAKIKPGAKAKTDAADKSSDDNKSDEQQTGDEQKVAAPVKDSAKGISKESAKESTEESAKDIKKSAKASKANQEELSVLEEKSDLFAAIDKKEKNSQDKTAEKTESKKPAAAKSEPAPVKTESTSVKTESTSVKTESTAEKSESTPAKAEPEQAKTKAPEPKTPAPKATTSASTESKQSSPATGQMGGMRVAPKKLTEREKLKLELEKGRKDGPSVL